jgi:hypothetical protein
MAVYDALVRMAQDFSSGTPLIDGHGNFGSVDADPAAAMRYTECRLTKVAHEALLDDLHKDTVDFVPNFDGNEVEPTVLPAKLPILLLNGCSGIAVGMATNVPPHNLRELMNACQALVKSRKQGAPSVTDADLFRLVPGPDFPTGATMMGTNGAKQLYLTGNGGVVLRANTQIEKVVTGKSKQSRSAIVVTQLPFQVNKAALLEKLADLVNDKKIEGIADLRDESDRDGIRVVIELKRDAVAAVVLVRVRNSRQQSHRRMHFVDPQMFHSLVRCRITFTKRRRCKRHFRVTFWHSWGLGLCRSVLLSEEHWIASWTFGLIRFAEGLPFNCAKWKIGPISWTVCWQHSLVSTRYRSPRVALASCRHHCHHVDCDELIVAFVYPVYAR